MQALKIHITDPDILVVASAPINHCACPAGRQQLPVFPLVPCLWKHFVEQVARRPAGNPHPAPRTHTRTPLSRCGSVEVEALEQRVVGNEAPVSSTALRLLGAGRDSRSRCRKFKMQREPTNLVWITNFLPLRCGSAGLLGKKNAYTNK